MPGRKDKLTGFEYFDHTGDLGIRLFGESLEDLFQQAGKAFTSIITLPEKIRLKEEKKIRVTADDPEGLLVNWLNEMVFLFDVRGMMFREFEILSVDKGSVSAIGRGEKYDPAVHIIKTLIKGATHHQLKIAKDHGKWEARVVLDL